MKNMCKKCVSILICSFICLSANGQAMNMFREFISPIDNIMMETGHYLNTFDLYIAPLKTHKDLMCLKGDVKKMTQTISIKKDEFCMSVGTYIDTVYFTPVGNVSKVKCFVSAQSILSFGPESVVVNYDKSGRLESMYKYGIEQCYDEMVNRIDETRFVYSNDGKLQSEIYNMYDEKDGKVKMVESFKDYVEMTYLYDANGNLSLGKRKMLNGEMQYNEHGMLSKIIDNGVVTADLKYDANDHLSTFYSLYVEDEMDESFNYRYDIKLARNDKGDVESAVKTRSRCNRYWKIIKKGLPKTYVVNYVYDSYGNWTKATLMRGKVTIATISRSFVY